MKDPGKVKHVKSCMFISLGNSQFNETSLGLFRVFLPLVSAVEVIESEWCVCLCVCVCVCVCEHSHSQTVRHMTMRLPIHNKKRTFGQKDCTILETREVRERSGVFSIVFMFSL